MFTRLILTAALLAAPLTIPGTASAAPRHHHPAARVSTATFHQPLAAKHRHDLRTSRQDHKAHARFAAGHRHGLSRGS